MATSGSYYINAPTLSSASSVFLDANLYNCAPDGFYSDGTIVRQQVACQLLDAIVCPSCIPDCGISAGETSLEGVFYMDVNLGEATGVVVIEFAAPIGIAGIDVTYDGVIYNTLSSPIVGMLEAPANLVTYIGNTIANCGISAGDTLTLDQYNYVGNGFIQTGSTSESVAAGQLQLTPSDPNTCIMIIPKPNATPSTLSVKIVAPCPTSAFTVNVECPATTGHWGLRSYNSSTLAKLNSAIACLDAVDTTYYHYPVSSLPGLNTYDYVFGDIYGVSPIADGWYKTDDNTVYEVTSGIITDMLTCL